MDVLEIDLTELEDRKRIFDLMQQHIVRKNYLALKRLSNELLEVGALKKNKEIIYLALLPYVLYKILSQPHIVRNKRWINNREVLLKELDKIENSKPEDYVKLVNNFAEAFKNINPELYRYIGNISNKGKLKLSANLCAKGFTARNAINYTDGDLIELNHYLHRSKNNELIKFKEDISSKVALLDTFIR